MEPPGVMLEPEGGGKDETDLIKLMEGTAAVNLTREEKSSTGELQPAKKMALNKAQEYSFMIQFVYSLFWEAFGMKEEEEYNLRARFLSMQIAW